jgi:hypothetical protein
MIFNRKSRQRKGAIIVYAAICMTALIGLAALTIDIGFKHDRLRHLQGAADASALAGAGDIYKRWFVNAGADPLNQAKTAATDIATKNGYTDGNNGTTVTVNIPPTSGLFTNANDGYTYIEVIIGYQQSRFFSRLFGTAALQTQARAVARASYGIVSEGVLVLDRHASGALNAHGGGVMHLTGSSGMIVDSDNASAAITNGSASSLLEAPQFVITGNHNSTGGSAFTQPDGTQPASFSLGNPPTPDPLAYLPPPPMPSLAPAPTIVNNQGVKTYTYYPGLYTSNGNNPAISNSGQDIVIMQPGIYYLQGGFSYNASGGLTANGVMIYNDPGSSQSQGISITGGGTVTMSPYNNGTSPYNGLVLYQNRTANVTAQITGNGNYNVTGTIYVAGGLVKISGNGDASIGSQYISRTLDIGGNGNLNIDYSGVPHPRQRILQLVE